MKHLPFLFLALSAVLHGTDTNKHFIASPSELKARIATQLHITRPDYVVFVPEVGDAGVSDTGNEHFLVFDGPDGSLMAVWTQSSVENYSPDTPPDQHITFSQSKDDGKTWSKPRILAGPKRAGDGPMASWAYPLVSRRGRIYVLYSQSIGKSDCFVHHTGWLNGIFSDDNGATWSEPQNIPVARSINDNPDPSMPPNMLCWQKPLRLGKDGKYLAGFTRWTSFEVRKPSPIKNLASADSRVEFMRFENVDDSPEPRDLKISWFAANEKALAVPYPKCPENSVCQEPSIVKLPDGRLFCVMRTGAGSPFWSVSADGGETWAEPRRLLRKDGGEPLLHPISPCPMYDVGGNEAGSGRYVLFIHDNDGNFKGYRPTPPVTGFNRRPVYLVAGRFQPGADQPVWFDEPRFFMDHDNVSLGKPGTSGRFDLSLYSSFTVRKGRPVLWYPDRKFFLLGRIIGKEWFDSPFFKEMGQIFSRQQVDDLQIIGTAKASERAPAPVSGRIAWWQEARFGMFIHWGLFSIPAGVWEGREFKRKYAEHIMLACKIPMAEYAELAREFNPQKFNADEWVGLAKRAGMRYLVFVAKHQDGFAMFDSKVSDFDVVDATPFKRDPAKELSIAAMAHGIKMGFYYSHARDHQHPLANWNKYGNTWDFPARTKEDFIRYLNEKAKPQIRELLTQYGDIGVMWFDVPYDIPPEESKSIVDLVRGLQPGCLVNSRVGGEVWDYRSLGDNQISDAALGEPWETCMTINDSWGYHRLDHNWKSSGQIIRHLVDIVSKGGNLLLNIGPKADGTIPEESVRCLEEIGRWMMKNGESIHGASASPIGQPAWGRCTAKGNVLYLHVFDWPSGGKLLVEGLPSDVGRAVILGDRQALGITREGGNATITLPAKPVDPADTVIALETAGPPAAPTTSAANAQADPANDWRRSKPDLVVYLPKEGEHHDGDNEMFIVFKAPKSEELLGMWTQSSVEGSGDNRIMLARSGDGIHWSSPQRIAGTPPGTKQPQASWGVPIVARTGRIYCVYVKEQPRAEAGQKQESGGIGCLYSDDNGATWAAGADIPMPRNRFDHPDPAIPKSYWLWTTATRDRHGRYLLGYTTTTSQAVKKWPSKLWVHKDSRCAFVRFENIDDGPDPKDLKVAWLPTDREGLEVPNRVFPDMSVTQEPCVVLLADGRMLVAMRTMAGAIWYSVSDDDGATWRKPEPLCYRDGGDPIPQPLAPAPIYPLADGRFLLVFHNNDGTRGDYSQWKTKWTVNQANYLRNPAFIAVGEFRPAAHQPIWFSAPKQILDTRGVIVGPKKTAEIATYPSLTEWRGQRVLWYPDRKYYLLGKYLPDSLLVDMRAP